MQAPGVALIRHLLQYRKCGLLRPLPLLCSPPVSRRTCCAWAVHSKAARLFPAALQMDSTEERLKAERELLNSTLKYLSAQAALQGAFKAGGSPAEGEEPVPPPGGPD